MPFVQTRTVRFGDVDHAGVVYYPRFFVYFHECFEDFFASRGLPYAKVLNERGVGFPSVHAEADYRVPLRFGDTFEIAMTNVRVGKKSVTFRYVVTRVQRDTQGDKRLEAAVGTVTSSCIDMKTFTGIACPDWLRELFSSVT